MINRNIPLKGLHYFEAVARNGSFKLAAEELRVTPPAISQQIKVLEDFLGLELFQRAPQRVHLTEQGQSLYRGVQSSFEILSHTIDRITDTTRHIRIKTTSSFYSLWLLPKIAEYEELNPSADIRVSAGIENHSFGPNHDIEIIYTPMPFENTNDAFFVLPEILVPVCSPEYKKRKKPKLPSVSSHRLILNSPEGYDWRKWGEENNIDNEIVDHLIKQSIKMISDASAIGATISGMGIGLANMEYVKDHLDSGRLVIAFNSEPFQLGCHYGRLVAQKRNRDIEKFSDYLASFAEQSYQDSQRAELEVVK